MLDEAVGEIMAQKQEVARLKAVADKHPFYKYNGVWSRELQNLVRDCSGFMILPVLEVLILGIGLLN